MKHDENTYYLAKVTEHMSCGDVAEVCVGKETTIKKASGDSVDKVYNKTPQKGVSHKEKSEMAVFWSEIERHLPDSEERHALGDKYLFQAVMIAYPQMKQYIRKEVIKEMKELVKKQTFAEQKLKEVENWGGHSYVKTPEVYWWFAQTKKDIIKALNELE